MEPHDFAEVSDRIQAFRREHTRDPDDWGTIVVSRIDLAEDFHRCGGNVLIDGRQSGDLIGSRPRSFRVEPGAHIVRVLLRRCGHDPLLFYNTHIQRRRAARASFTCVVARGACVELSCGRKKEWVRPPKMTPKHRLVTAIDSLVAVVFSFAIVPLISWAVDRAATNPHFAAWPLSKISRSIHLCGNCFSFLLAYFFVHTIICYAIRQKHKNHLAEYGPPHFLVENVGSRQIALKKDQPLDRCRELDS